MDDLFRMLCLFQICGSTIVFACTLLELKPDYEGISAVCCESTASPDCSVGFPATCTRQCAALVTPFWADCKVIVMAFEDIFPSDEAEFQQFAEGPCQQTTLLYEHASVGGCAGPELEMRVDEVQQACCEQEAHYVCADGAPWACNAECEYRPAQKCMKVVRPHCMV